MSKRLSLFVAFFALIFSSCEKVVDIDLDDADPQYVIEAEVYEGVDTVEVQIFRSTDYYGKSPQQPIDHAVVILSDETGDSTQIPAAGQGRYLLPGFTGVAGRRYNLSVTVDGKIFTARAVMQQPIQIDSVTAEFRKADFRSEGYEVAARFTDPAGVQNFYRVIYTINDTLQNEPGDLYLLNDKFTDGKVMKADLFRRFLPGDKIEFELRTMDEKVFDFFVTLNDVLNNQEGPAPSNPNTNIQGGALGYFGAFTSSRKTIIVTD